MSKKIVGYIKLVIPAGKANPSPPVGPALGQKGVNIMLFCQAFNEATKNEKPGAPVPVVITVYVDKSFTFIRKVAPVSFLIKDAIDLKKGSGETGKAAPVAKITRAQLKEIAEKKMIDMNAYDINAAISMVAGTACSMGIEVVE
jgi:large subunit ribosomal protein L11